MRTLALRALCPALLLASLAAPKALAEDAPADQPKITFDEHVKPILRDNCVFCHSQDEAKSDLALDAYGSLMRGGAGGQVVVPGDPDSSRLWKLVSHQESPQMPPEQDKLPDEVLETLRVWIERGALENSGSTAQIKPKKKIQMSAAAGAGRPDGPPPMPEGLSRRAQIYAAHGTPLTALAVSPWAPLVAVASQQQVLLYHSETAELLGVLPFPEGIPHVLKFSRSGTLLLAGGGRGGKSGRVVVFEVRTGKRVFEIGDELDTVLAADINEDHTQIALGGPSKVLRVYNTADGSLAYESRKHTEWILAVDFSPDGVLLASADRNGGLFVWEAETGREYLTLRGHEGAVNDVSWRDDSNLLASASEDGTVRLWEVETGTQVKGWGAHNGAQSVRFAHDGRLVSTGREQRAKLWNGEGAIEREFEPLGDVALEAAVTHDGSRVVAGGWTGDLRVFQLADGAQLASLSVNPPALAQLAQAAAERAAQARAQVESLAAEVAALQTQLAQQSTALEAGQAELGTAETQLASLAELKATAEKLALERAAAFEAAQAQLAAAMKLIEQTTLDKEAADKLLAAQAAAHQALADAAAAQREAAQRLAAERDAAQQQLAAKAADLAAAQERARQAATDAEQIAAEQAADEAARAAAPAEGAPADGG